MQSPNGKNRFVFDFTISFISPLTVLQIKKTRLAIDADRNLLDENHRTHEIGRAWLNFFEVFPSSFYVLDLFIKPAFLGNFWKK